MRGIIFWCFNFCFQDQWNVMEKLAFIFYQECATKLHLINSKTKVQKKKKFPKKLRCFSRLFHGNFWWQLWENFINDKCVYETFFNKRHKCNKIVFKKAWYILWRIYKLINVIWTVNCNRFININHIFNINTGCCLVAFS